MSNGETFRSVKGTFDILPDASSSDGSIVAGSAAWRRVEDTVREVAARYGVREIRTPILESASLIARGVGESTDIVSKEMFAFERGDTQYVLRPEVTAPVIRAYLQHHLDQQRSVQKLYYVGPCFRAERPQKGRYRQFHQFGVEYIGSASVLCDVEVIALMLDIYAGLGISDCRVRVNTLGDASARPVFRDALKEYFAPFAERLSETSRQRLVTNPLRILDTKNPDERELLDDAPRLIDYVSDSSRERFDRLQEMLDALGVETVVDPFLVRGLDYYTETAFEVETDLLGGSQNALAGGGRYDLLAEELGSKNPVPAVGFAAGIERLFLALQAAGADFPTDPAPDLYVVVVGSAAGRWAVVAVRELRATGVAVEVDVSERSVKARMREANRVGSRYVLVVGDNELAETRARVRDMSVSTEHMIDLSTASIREFLTRAASKATVQS